MEYFKRATLALWLIVFLERIASQSTQSSVASQRECCFKDRVVTSCYNVCKENTCENLRNSSSQSCPALCLPNICVCREGLYRNECNECVTKDECSKSCSLPTKIQCPGQFETLCGCLDPTQTRVCPSTNCSKPRDFLLKYSRTSPQHGLCAVNTCDCIDGFLRNKCGQCVPPSECGKKCCTGKCSPCSGPNEVRIKKFRKCQERSCKNMLKSPMECKGKAGRVRKNVCDCKIGYRRNKCGQCVPEDQCNENLPCLCTNPCDQPDQEWQCLNECSRTTCKNYYELQNKTCSSECLYVCSCSANQNKWFNGTACVSGDQCPPYEVVKNMVAVPISSLVQPVPPNFRAMPNEPTTESTTLSTTTMTTTATLPAITQNPGGPIISITVNIG